MLPVFHHHTLQFLQSLSAAKSLRKFLTYPIYYPSPSHTLSYQFFIMNLRRSGLPKSRIQLKKQRSGGREELISQIQNLPRSGVEI